jgi:NTP pyrophosphatase (non-canonical NTP hydrolase)
MTNDEKIDLYLRALYEWGADAQTLMVFEEMSELQKELCKYIRGRDNVENIADEIADVIIMLEQMMVLFACEQLVKERKEYKLERLKKRLCGEL